ncbi:MAG: type II toxin-antitoxin system VapC family toxin [Trueperaceae bacterium]|nr:MAG: type II toxin-antitoxin system VapC family toxin [Trueperaceae bacterium]
MRLYLLDTDTLSALVRDPAGAVVRRIATVGEETVATTPIVAGELRFGALRYGSAPLVERVEGLLARLQVLPLDDQVARSYADLRRALERAGTPIGPNDLWIAAHALAAERVLVTGKLHEFRRLSALAVEDWRDGH